MSQDFVSAFMANLAGSGVTLNPTLQSIFASILANQITTNDDGELVLGSSFDTLAQIFTFISTPEDNRPEAGPLGYDSEVIEQAKTDTATEQGVELDDGLTNTNDSRTFTIASDISSVTEGDTVTLTVTASEASDTDQTLTYSVAGATVAGDPESEADPLTDLGILNGQVTILAGETTATIELTPASDNSTEGLEGFIVNLLDSDFAITASSNTVAIQDPANAGQSFALTASVDDFNGGAGNDTFTGIVDGTGEDSTWTALDSLDGGDGEDVLNISDVSDEGDSGINLAQGSISGIETLNIQAVSDIFTTAATAEGSLDVSDIDGLMTINTTKSTGVDLTAADDQDVNVSGATGVITVRGGNDVTITDDNADAAIVVTADGENDVAGAITVIDTDNSGDEGEDDLDVDGGTTVTITATTDSGATADITVGNSTAASDAVSITQNIVSDGDGGIDNAESTIDVTGGTTITIDVNATIDAADAEAEGDVSAANIVVSANDDTTAVTITQSADITTFTEEAVAAVGATQTVTFDALAAEESVSVGDAGGTSLTFTATTALTADEVAAAFANLTLADTQVSGGPTANGYFEGALGDSGEAEDASWVSGDADGDTVTFTAYATDAEGNTALDATGTTLAVGGDSEASAGDLVAGTAAVAATETVNTFTAGVVTIGSGDVEDTDALTTVTIDGFSGASSIDSDALTTVTLRNSESAADLEITTASTGTLNLTVDNIDGEDDGESGISLDGEGASVTALNLTVESDSNFALVADAVTDLDIDAQADLDIDAAETDLTALTDVTITGAGSVDLGNIVDAEGAGLDSFDASANTGGITATVSGDAENAEGFVGDIEEYIFSAGADDISFADEIADVAVTLGAGDDNLTLVSAEGEEASVALTADVDGGEGTDTLTMTVTSAAAFDGDAIAAVNFERLEITDVDGAEADATVDVETMGFDYVTVTGITDEDAANDNFTVQLASGSTVVVSGDVGDGVASAEDADSITVEIDAEDTASDDVLNVILDSAESDTDLDADTLIVNNVETINISSLDSDPVDAEGDGEEDFIETNTVILSADSVTELTITGNATTDLILVDAEDASVTANLETITASDMTGDLTLTAVVDDLVITAGAGGDDITVGNGEDAVSGIEVDLGAGSNTVTINALADNIVVTAGDDIDTFVISGAASNVDSYAVFQNVGSGDIFDFSALTGTSFVAAEIELSQGATESSQAYANQAAKNLDINQVGWFQYDNGSGVNTFIVISGATDADGFDPALDAMVMITGAVDLSTASFNATDSTLEIA